MAISKLKGVLGIFSGDELSERGQAQLYKEVALMTRSQTTSADSNINININININNVAVEMVRKVLRQSTAEEFSAADIRVAAHSALFERAPLGRYLRSVVKKLSWQDRLSITDALAEVIKVDQRVTEREIEFFNQIADALNLTPAQLVGLKPDQ